MSVGCGAEGSHEEPDLGEAGGPGVDGVHKEAFDPRLWPPHSPGARAEAAEVALPNMAARADVTGGCGSAGVGRGPAGVPEVA